MPSVVKRNFMMNRNRYKLGFCRRRGVTLPELMVAVAITIGMLLLTGMVFKSATDASGQAMAYSEILQQARAVMLQLDQDFRGLRPDLPMAIIFEEDTVTFERRDRIVFFANGDYQTLDYGNGNSISGNVARIYYGQANDIIEMPDSDNPDRRILFRRFKILTADNTLNWFTLPSPSSYPNINYDYNPVENATLSYWKNLDFINFSDNTSPNLGLFYENTLLSFIRRPVYQNIQDEIYNGNIGGDVLQAMYLLPDVTNFKVETWFASSAVQAWFPNDQYRVGFDSLLLNNNTILPGNDLQNPFKFAFYWNVTGAPSDPAINNTIDNSNKLDWLSDQQLQTINTGLSGMGYGFNVWPSALKFTFTLYDKGRRYFPEGVEFSYIVKLPPRP